MERHYTPAQSEPDWDAGSFEPQIAQMGADLGERITFFLRMRQETVHRRAPIRYESKCFSDPESIGIENENTAPVCAFRSNHTRPPWD